LQADLYNRYKALQNETLPIPCSTQLPTVPAISVSAWIERMAIERLETFCDRINTWMSPHQDRDIAFWTLVAHTLGAPVNSAPMEALIQLVPVSTLVRMQNRPGYTQALLLGLAGLLPQDKSVTSVHLCKLFEQISSDYHLKPLDRHVWKRSRMRPASFPEVRVAQLAGLMAVVPELWSMLLDATDLKNVKLILTTALEAASIAQQVRAPGSELIDRLVINVVVPFLFAYGKQQGDELMTDRAQLWWALTKPENNHATRLWQEVHIRATHAAQSQGLLHLEKNYCRPKRCLQCAIGLSLLRPQNQQVEETDKNFFLLLLAQLQEERVSLHRQTAMARSSIG